MLTKRIVPCLDVKNGRVVKGTNFVNLRDAGDPVELAKKYNEEGADELVFLDITASVEERKTIYDIVRNVSRQLFIPFTVGGGISTVEDMQKLLFCGADKISVNTAAIKNPGIIKQASSKFGSQCIVVAIDAKKTQNSWNVFINGGRTDTRIDAIEWAKKVQQFGAGEILLTSMDRDGTKKGFDIGLTKIISESINIPVIASGGAGDLKSISDIFEYGCADAMLAASIFHYGKFSVSQVKEYLAKNNMEVRL
ncbi:MAG: imidazole glycerol phosphate synthase subunit HisF [Candidatus Aenigmarchaeota archaeon]|nr:imidazole glycerol phosphate synthase subunit HisF [Candidatus Aenigmarchaeota archaeon]